MDAHSQKFIYIVILPIVIGAILIFIFLFATTGWHNDGDDVEYGYTYTQNTPNPAVEIHRYFTKLNKPAITAFLNKHTADVPDESIRDLSFFQLVEPLTQYVMNHSTFTQKQKNSYMHVIKKGSNCIHNDSPVYRILIGRSVLFAMRQPYAEEYAKSFVYETTHAYKNDDLSCHQGILERFVTENYFVVKQICASMPEKCTGEYEKILQVFKETDINDIAKEWYERNRTTLETIPVPITDEKKLELKNNFIQYARYRYGDLGYRNSRNILFPEIEEMIRNYANDGFAYFFNTLELGGGGSGGSERKVKEQRK